MRKKEKESISAKQDKTYLSKTLTDLLKRPAAHSRDLNREFTKYQSFSGEPNLTFFRRSDSIETGTLNRYDAAGMYQKLLGVSVEESVKLAKFVQGYAYAYQVLGSLYYNKEAEASLADLIPAFDRVLFRDSYDLIWKSLTSAEKGLVKIIVSSSGRVSDIKGRMESPKSFNSLRDRLEKKHLVNAEERGVLTIDLPRFREFIDIWEDT